MLSANCFEFLHSGDWIICAKNTGAGDKDVSAGGGYLLGVVQLHITIH